VGSLEEVEDLESKADIVDVAYAAIRAR
jgi:hypothetical protein